jgi:hypothetical protein
VLVGAYIRATHLLQAIKPKKYHLSGYNKWQSIAFWGHFDIS